MIRVATLRAKALAQLYLALMVEYRAEIYLWAFASVLPLVMLGFWLQAGDSGAFEFSRVQFIRYFFAAFLVSQFTAIAVIWEFEELVVSGRLSILLVQPMNPVWRFLMPHLVTHVVRLPIVLCILGAGFIAYPEAVWIPRLKDLLLGFGMLLAAFLTRFLLQYAVSMVAFWTERASTVEEIWSLLQVFLSGLVAPLALYPSFWRHAAELTPFPYLIYYPAMSLMGRVAPTPVPYAKAALVLGAWLLAAGAMQFVLWRKGIRRYSAMGA
jgi:ABC-2 type transport system permease protein